MANSFRDLIAHDFRTVVANANEFGTTVSITRGLNVTNDVSAFVDLLQTAANAVGGTTVEYTSRDYLIVRADYKINGTAVDPALADVITDGDYEYEVMAPEGDRPFTWEDPNGTLLRVRTQRKGAS